MGRSPRRAKNGSRVKKANVFCMSYLRFHRYRMGLTQAQLAKRIGVSQGTYCAYERGSRRPLAKRNARLAEAIGRTVEEVTAKIHNVDLTQVGYDEKQNRTNKE